MTDEFGDEVRRFIALLEDQFTSSTYEGIAHRLLVKLLSERDELIDRLANTEQAVQEKDSMFMREWVRAEAAEARLFALPAPCGDVVDWEVRGQVFTYKCNKPAGHDGDHREDFNMSGAGVSWPVNNPSPTPCIARDCKDGIIEAIYCDHCHGTGEEP
jgi:hypothetical protein